MLIDEAGNDGRRIEIAVFVKMYGEMSDPFEVYPPKLRLSNESRPLKLTQSSSQNTKK